MGKLVNEGIISKAGSESYFIKRKNFEYEFDAVKEEVDGLMVANHGKATTMGLDPMYMKALYHALPMTYVTVAKLQSKLEGEASHTTVWKLIDKMTQDGFVEASSNGRLGKRVIHSDLTKKKLLEVKKLLDPEAMELDMNESVKKFNLPEADAIGKNHKDLSTYGGLHSIGSDVTRTRGRSNAYQNSSMRTELGFTRRENGNTPTSRIEPAASRESFVPGAADGQANGKTNHGDEVTTITGSRSTQEKRSRKSSMVKEPILQSSK